MVVHGRREQDRRDPGRDQRFAGRRRADAGDDLLDGAVLEHVAARAGEDRIGHVGLLRRHAEDQDARGRGLLGQAPRSPRCRIPGMSRSMTTTSGRVAATDSERGLAVGHARDDVDAVLPQQAREALAIERVIVGDHDTQGSADGPSSMLRSGPLDMTTIRGATARTWPPELSLRARAKPQDGALRAGGDALRSSLVLDAGMLSPCGESRIIWP